MKLDYIEIHGKHKPAIDLLTTEEKAKLLDMLLTDGLEALGVDEIDQLYIRENRTLAAVYQMILNDSV